MTKYCGIEELYQAFLKTSGVSIDTRTLQKGALFFALKGPNFDGNQYARQAIDQGAKYVIVDDPEVIEPGNAQYLLVEHTLDTLQKLATYHRLQSNCKVFALTGSNGKTTTKELIAKVLEQKFRIIYTQGNLNNHIGVPLTLLTIGPDTEVAIIEMGANHIGEIGALCRIARPEIGLITNIGEAHLEGFGSREGIRQGKGELFEFLKANKGTILVNTDEQFLDEMAGDYEQRWNYDNQRIGAWKLEFNGDERLEIHLQSDDSEMNYELALYGSYNQPNVLAAINLGLYLGIELKTCLKAVASYRPENKRSEVINTTKNKIILDAYNANPSSMRKALLAFEQMEGVNKVIILGDMFELGDESKVLHQEIVDMADKVDASSYFVGENFSMSSTMSRQFNDIHDIEEFLKQKEVMDSLILIKGSRGMALERLVPLL